MTSVLQPTVYLARVCTRRSSQGWLDAPDGALAVGANGVIDGVGARESLLQAFPGHKVEDHRDCLILPGFVDCHQHLCHTEWVRLIPDLFEWLDAIYAIEARFASTRHAEAVAVRFFTELARNGTTTCCVHGSYFVEATRAAFAVAARFNLRILMGMNAGDTHLPEGLRQSPAQSTADQSVLYSEWNGANSGLLTYCFTVRPAYCASEDLLHCIAQAQMSGARCYCYKHILARTHLGEKEPWGFIGAPAPN